MRPIGSFGTAGSASFGALRRAVNPAMHKRILTVAESQNRRPTRTPNQYLTPTGDYLDAETFYHNVDWSLGAL